MAFKSFAVAVETTDTEVIECPATQEGAAVLNISNVSGGAATYTLKFYRQSAGASVVIANAVSIAANTTTKYPAPLSMQSGDKLIVAASASSAIVASGTFTHSGATPVATGFTPRGEYSGVATYDANDVVHFTDGNSYLSIQNANTGHAPDTSPAYWMVLTEKGAQGDGDLSSAANLADLSDAAAARENLGLKIGTDVQPYDAALFAGIPYNAKAANYTAVLADANAAIGHSGADNNARTFTIPANSAVAFPVGTVLVFQNSANVVTIAINSDTLIFQGSGATGSRQLAANGTAVAWKVSSTVWFIFGVGLS